MEPKDSDIAIRIKRGKDIFLLLEEFNADSMGRVGIKNDEYGHPKALSDSTLKRNREKAIETFIFQNGGKPEQAEFDLQLAEILNELARAKKPVLIEAIENGTLKLSKYDLDSFLNKSETPIADLYELLQQQTN